MSIATILRKRSLLLLLPLLATGCGDPYQRPGTWHIAGVNDANLGPSVVDKTDLVAGHETPGSDSTLDAAAVDRLYTDKPRKLPAVSTSSSYGSGS